MKEFELKEETIIMSIFAEVAKAELKHPKFADGFIDQAAVIGEESGEVLRAALQNKYEGGAPEEMVKEVIQTAATCIRFLKEYPNILSTLYEIDARAKAKLKLKSENPTFGHLENKD